MPRLPPHVLHLNGAGPRPPKRDDLEVHAVLDCTVDGDRVCYRGEAIFVAFARSKVHGDAFQLMADHVEQAWQNEDVSCAHTTVDGDNFDELFEGYTPAATFLRLQAAELGLPGACGQVVKLRQKSEWFLAFGVASKFVDARRAAAVAFAVAALLEKAIQPFVEVRVHDRDLSCGSAAAGSAAGGQGGSVAGSAAGSADGGHGGSAAGSAAAISSADGGPEAVRLRSRSRGATGTRGALVRLRSRAEIEEICRGAPWRE